MASTTSTSKSKKAIIALASVCALMLVALITVVSVWAASSQTINSTLQVTYSATNVSATVTGAYRLQEAETYTTIGSATFVATDKSQTKSISTTEPIELTDTIKYVVFRYTFKNNSETTAFKVSLTKTVTKTNNITVVYTSSSDPLDSGATISGEDLDDFIVTGGETMYAYIKVKLENITNNADFSANVAWNMVSTTEVPEENA